MNEEVWKVHPIYTDYAVSDQGRVKRLTAKKGTRAGRIAKPTLTSFGYEAVGVTPPGEKSVTKFVHVLVLEAHAGLRLGHQEARHLNDIKTDNRLANLRWGTHAENYGDRRKNGGGNQGSRHGRSKLTEADVLAIRAAYIPRKVTYAMLAKELWRMPRVHWQRPYSP